MGGGLVRHEVKERRDSQLPLVVVALVAVLESLRKLHI